MRSLGIRIFFSVNRLNLYNEKSLTVDIHIFSFHINNFLNTFMNLFIFEYDSVFNTIDFREKARVVHLYIFFSILFSV